MNTAPGPQRPLQLAILTGFVVATVLMAIAASLYPGGSLFDPTSVGFVWSRNFICNLFEKTAFNGEPNPGRVWALVGIAFHSIAEGLFFLRMARVIHHRHTQLVLRIVGFGNIAFNFMIATPYHDAMVVISSTLSLLGLFYITVFVLRSRLHLLKVCCVLGMLLFYFTLFLYGVGDWSMLAVMQKVTLIVSTLLVLALTWFTRAEDFVKRVNAA
ncbi:MAG TPA: hypothetical protein VGE21_05435 [Flavobacteriales bacterium]